MLYVEIKHTAWVTYLSLCLGEGEACRMEGGQALRVWGPAPLSSIQPAI